MARTAGIQNSHDVRFFFFFLIRLWDRGACQPALGTADEREANQLGETGQQERGEHHLGTGVYGLVYPASRTGSHSCNVPTG